MNPADKMRRLYGSFICGQLLFTRNTFGRRLYRSINISACRLLQPVPPDALPGVTMVLPYTNMPRRIPRPRPAAIVMPSTDLGSIFPQ
jgi:hypothetical protein